MRTNYGSGTHTDDWLEGKCRQIQEAGQTMAETVGEVNERMEQASSGSLGKRKRITEAQVQQVEQACRALHDVQVSIQEALFDTEHELRELRERDVSPAELLIDGERLIRQYRFLRRRGRVIDGLLAYLPAVTHHANVCLEHLRMFHDGIPLEGIMVVPDCGFALVALEQLRDGDE